MRTPMKASDYLGKDELAALMRRSDARGWWEFLCNWGLIVGAFALAIKWPLAAPLSILIIASRQLGLGILVHDCAHHALFQDRRTNEKVGHWLAGAPINLSLAGYRTYHLKHHRHAGSPDDPDLVFVANYPVARTTLRRKFTRDITGQTGFRDLKASLARFKIAEQWPWLVFHAGLFAVLALAGGWWAYFLWWIAQLFAYPVIARLRQIGEHGVVPDRGDPDPRMNTSTTIARWWERLFIAPNHVNFHVEHHLAAGVPSYRLPAMHRLLRERGFFDGFDCVSHGYVDVVRRATHQPA